MKNITPILVALGILGAFLFFKGFGERYRKNSDVIAAETSFSPHHHRCIRKSLCCSLIPSSKQTTLTMKLSVALATLAVGGASAFSINQNGLRTTTQLNAVRQPIMAGNWKVSIMKISKCVRYLGFQRMND